ncbi:MAG TPA: S1 RNA-binding domain-containing protein, partial [Acidimicrobiales bacterium]|nr:S1 RNA-binding domain-containing protein [Acidimicrobiales bacterium]
MSPTRVVVDGSNIATEGRNLPSLRQLDQAVRQFQKEFPDSEPIVVVDATFGHRIADSERKAFEDGLAHGELVSPPAGAIGRGDAFVLRIAERVGGQVLSNDSFQEFHLEHPWLFEEGRLVGGKPVPGVGWIFTPRLPVRGPRSRAASATAGAGASKAAGRTTKAGSGAARGTAVARPRRRARAAVLEAVEAAAAEATEAATAAAEDLPLSSAPARGAKKKAEKKTGKKTSTTSASRRRRRRRGGDPEVQAAIEAATEEAIGRTGADGTDGAARTRQAGPAAIYGPQAVNDPLTFLTFISEHALGSEVSGEVCNFVSHGAMVDVGPMHCYVPLSGLGDPPPNSARAALRKGETRRFVLVALDPPRRGAQLALPDTAASKAKDVPDTAKAKRGKGRAASARAAPAATSPTASSPGAKPPEKKFAEKKSPGKKPPGKHPPGKKSPGKKAARA